MNERPCPLYAPGSRDTRTLPIHLVLRPPAWNECIFSSAPRMPGLGRGGPGRGLGAALRPLPGFLNGPCFRTSGVRLRSPTLSLGALTPTASRLAAPRGSPHARWYGPRPGGRTALGAGAAPGRFRRRGRGRLRAADWPRAGTAASDWRARRRPRPRPGRCCGSGRARVCGGPTGRGGGAGECPPGGGRRARGAGGRSGRRGWPPPAVHPPARRGPPEPSRRLPAATASRPPGPGAPGQRWGPQDNQETGARAASVDGFRVRCLPCAPRKPPTSWKVLLPLLEVNWQAQRRGSDWREVTQLVSGRPGTESRALESRTRVSAARPEAPWLRGSGFLTSSRATHPCIPPGPHLLVSASLPQR